MKCLECKAEFAPLAVNQLYCSVRCGDSYRKKHPDETHFPPVSFCCSYCGKAVVTDGKKDKRTRFCSHTCEKKYWRHPPSEHSALRTESERMAQWNERREI